jgi:hypothetical protein
LDRTLLKEMSRWVFRKIRCALGPPLTIEKRSN